MVGATAISFSAVWFALAEVSAVTGAFFRSLYAIPVLAALWWRQRQSDHRSVRSRWLAVAAGGSLAGDFIFWHLAIDEIGTGLATLIANCQVVIVSVFAWLVFREKPSRSVIVAIPVVLGGLALVTGLGQESAFGADPLLGTLLGIGSAIFYGTFLLAFRRSNDSRSPAAGPLLDATVGALAATALAAPILGGLDPVPAWPAHGWLLALAIGSQVIGWLAIAYALPRLPAAETSTFILVQPVMTMVWGALFFAETPSPVQLGGAALVLAGVGMVVAFMPRRPQPRASTVRT